MMKASMQKAPNSVPTRNRNVCRVLGKVLQKVKRQDFIRYLSPVRANTPAEPPCPQLPEISMFQRDHMVTAFDVKYEKPHPEPYLMGLEKAGVQANEAIVVENAPIGVQAGTAAGIFTVAVNTGPLDRQVLLDAGADLLFPSMQALCDDWERLQTALDASSLRHKD